MRTVFWEGNKVKMIDQRLLPAEFVIVAYDTVAGVAEGIRDMAVRGAPAIGATGAYGMALAAYASPAQERDSLLADLRAAKTVLDASRPTAVNLSWGTARMLELAEQTVLSDIDDVRSALLAEAEALADEDVEINRRMGFNGAALIADGANLLHHCNTGALAAVDFGTALGVVFACQEQGKNIHVWVDETRPRLQGARLTAAGPQYLIQLGAAAIAIAGMIFIKHVNDPLTGTFFFGDDGFPWWIVWPLTVFWFMGMMNTINFLDGASGLVAGVTAILSAVLALHMIFKAEPPQLSVALLPLALTGVALGFLPFNFAPARIFMGSSGSYFLGFAVASLGIIGGARLATVLMVVGLPALEVGWLMVTRWQRGVSPGQGGRDHLHFRLLDMGVSERALVLGYWAFCAALGALTLLVDSTLYKLISLIILTGVALAVFVWAARRPASEETTR